MQPPQAYDTSTARRSFVEPSHTEASRTTTRSDGLDYEYSKDYTIADDEGRVGRF